MKKALLAMLLAVATLVPITLTASPAEAACAAPVWKRAGMDFNYGTDGNFRITGEIRFARCTSGVKVLQYNVVIDPKNKDGLASCKWRKGADIDYWRVNPNVIGHNGAWNPGTRTTDCDSWRTHVIVWTPPVGLKVYAGDPANERCISSIVTAVRPRSPDTTVNLPSICVI